MSEANIDVVRRGFDAFSRGDIDGLLRLVDQDIVITQDPDVPVGSPQQHGHAGFLEALNMWPEQWDDFRIEIERVVADPGDYVVMLTRQHGRGKQSGVEVEARFTFVFAVRDERISEWRIFIDEQDALASIDAG